MPQNSDPNMWAEIAAYFAAALATVTAWAWKHTHGVIGRKAESATVESLMQRIDRTFENHRQDTQRIYDEISDVSTSLRNHVEKVTEELGKRPTRDECQRFWHAPGKQ